MLAITTRTGWTKSPRTRRAVSPTSPKGRDRPRPSHRYIGDQSRRCVDHHRAGPCTSVRFTCPSNDATTELVPRRHAGAGGGGTETLLLFEDKHSVRARICRQSAAPGGYVVHEARDARIAEWSATSCIMPQLLGRTA